VPTSIQIKTIVGLVITVVAFVFLAHGISAAPSVINSAFSWAVTVIAFALLLWERWLWSWPIFRPWMTDRPDLRGTWKGQLTSNWIDAETKLSRDPIEVYLVIRQTFSTVDVRFFSSGSSSISLSASVYSDNVGLYTLAVTYRNTPRVLQRARNPIGHGGMLLSIRGAPIHQLDGEYWTDRGTKGEMTLRERCRGTAAADFDHAQRCKY
jgi:hypothetical protein